MKKRKTYLLLTVILSVLFGIILPIALGVKDPTLIAITFSSVLCGSFMWLSYLSSLSWSRVGRV